MTFPQDTPGDAVMLSALLAAQVTAGGTSLHCRFPGHFPPRGTRPLTQASLGWHPAGPAPRCSPCNHCRPPAAHHPAMMAAPAPHPACQREGPWRGAALQQERAGIPPPACPVSISACAPPQPGLLFSYRKDSCFSSCSSNLFPPSSLTGSPKPLALLLSSSKHRGG